MRLLGAAMVFCAAAGFGLLRRREQLLPLRLGRALLEDLAVLGCQVRVSRAPLPEILGGVLAGGPGGRWLWRPLLELLETEGEKGLPWCWIQAAEALPGPLGGLLAPLGPLLPLGGERLCGAIEETREELTRFLRAEADRQASQGRVTAALCLCGACLLVLVLL